MKDLPNVQPINMQPRMMMAESNEVFMDSSPEQRAFSIGVEIENLEEQLRLEQEYSPEDYMAGYDTRKKIVELREQQQKIMQTPNFDMGEQLRLERNSNKESYDQYLEEYMNQSRPQLKGGGDFPDLTGDGKVTQADILKGRGVYAEGDEVMMMQETDMMAPGNQEIEASLMEVQGMQPDMQVLDQYVQMVTQMIQAGASEAEVIESLRQAGLDDDDIAAVFQAVMETMQGSMEQGGIDAELAQLG